MAVQRHAFESIESAQEFIELLAETIEDARCEIEHERCLLGANEGRRGEAWLLALHKLKTLAFHVHKSQRALKDLRTLRRLLDGEMSIAAVADVPTAGSRNGHLR